MIRPELEKVRCNYDVLMDGYPWYAGVHFWHEAAQLAAALLKDNPTHLIQVRRNLLTTQLTKFYRGVEIYDPPPGNVRSRVYP